MNFSSKKGGALLSGVSSSYKRISSYFLKASMTVEACFVLPFFLFAFLNIMSIMDMYRIQGDMSAAIHDTEKKLAVNAYEYKAVRQALTGSDDSGKLESLGLSFTYVNATVANKMENLYPTDTNWAMSSILETDDCIDLIAVYSFKPPIGVMSFGNQSMFNRLRTRAWTGYDNAANGTDGSGEEEIVYVAETGTVYHRSRACTYLKLSISAVSASSVADERNEGGARYYGCEECGSRSAGTLYITNHGTKYHTTLSCSKLKRTIYAVHISEVGGKGACSKCG